MASIYREKLAAPGTFEVKVKGTSAYQDALLRISGRKEFQGKKLACVACLISEPTNPHDRNAIRVEIERLRVGYLSRHLAAFFGEWLRMNGYTTMESPCDAMIIGGWEVDEFETFGTYGEGAFGVRLDIASPGSSEVEECTASQFTFAPMLQNSITDNVIVSDEEAFDLRIGDPVTLWQGENDPSFISIFARGSLAGVGRIGYVPPQYYKILADQMRNELPIESRISHIEGGQCFIRCRLVSSDEVEFLRLEEMEKCKAALSKPYSPVKPICAVVTPLDSSSSGLNRGDRLTIVRKPTIQEFLEGNREPNLIFEGVGGSGLYQCDDKEVKKKIIRIGDLIALYQAKVCRTHRFCLNGWEIELFQSSKKERK